jgi:predicted NBD/HSP70 family sugar kinase
MIGRAAAEEAAQLRARGIRVAGAAAALPGLTDRPIGPLRLAPNLGWADVDVAACLRAALGDDLLSLGNEADLAARCELAAAGGAPARSFLYLSGGHGVGGAIVLDGRCHSGDHGWAGEIGHMTINPDGPACSCGSRGCLERYASLDAITARAGLPAGSTGADIVAAWQAGAQAAQGAVDQAAAALGVAAANAFKLLDITHAVLGGMFGLLAQALAPGVEAELRRRLPPAAWGPAATHVACAVALDRPALTGAALSVTDRVFANPGSYLTPSAA